jgi:hypothetical protein
MHQDVIEGALALVLLDGFFLGFRLLPLLVETRFVRGLVREQGEVLLGGRASARFRLRRPRRGRLGSAALFRLARFSNLFS